MLAAHIPKTVPAPRIRVLIVDDSVVMRKILTDALREVPDIEVVGTASNGLIALQRIPQLNPDVVTLDIEMPELDGIATLREIKRLHPRLRVLMCSSLTERGASITMEALSFGADDYLTKSSQQNTDNSISGFHNQLVPKIRQFFKDGKGSPADCSPPDHRTPRLASSLDSATARSGLSLASGATPVPRVSHPRARAVAIGVSTGGPNALAEVIPALPRHFPLPVLIVQHMPPMFTRLLAERLQSHSQLRVVEAQAGMPVAAGTVYIAPGDFHMVVTRRGSGVEIQLNQDSMENSCRPAVDVLFRSMAAVYGGATVSAILTGMGQDGLRGVEQLRTLGGYVIAQDEASSVVWGMPGFVARAGLADSICDLKSIAPEIIRHI
jgi:two-component system chemotaxis response regulator CheB